MQGFFFTYVCSKYYYFFEKSQLWILFSFVSCLITCCHSHNHFVGSALKTLGFVRSLIIRRSARFQIKIYICCLHYEVHINTLQSVQRKFEFYLKLVGFSFFFIIFDLKYRNFHAVVFVLNYSF